ncbi:hemicentin-1-like [Leptodactylus fuscus]|uniref:hemicentin-1-like n=1 Tax=Leptodactylus fuscus TaxID=238119 RepID=UPI003F4E9EEE
MALVTGLLILLTALSLSSGAVYVRRGSDIADCSMKCPHTQSVLMLYRVCGGDERPLLEMWCDSMWYFNHLEPKLHLNTSSGCWTLTDAGKDDSCVYNTVHHRNGGSSCRSIHITVLDPVLVSTITSNSSRLGQDIAVSVQFSGEEAAVTWEVDGGPVPDRYRLIDDNRTMIIPSARIDDAGRRLHVRITNPVSEETREYQLEITVPHRSRVPLIVPLLVANLVLWLVLSVRIFLFLWKIKPRDEEVKMISHSVLDGCPPRSRSDPGLLILLTRLSLSSGAVYVRRGSDITDCSMKCPHTESVLELYRVCGGDESNLLELWCDSMWSLNRLEPRLHLNTSSGCWTLTDAGKDDSCVYNVLYHSDVGSSRRSIHITVLDPVLISNITSNSSRLGQDIAVSVQFSGEEAAVTWEVDGGPVPDRYQLIDDNRTMIIPSAQIDDAGRRLHVRITNPVSEETREYQLEITAVPHTSFVPLLVVPLLVLWLVLSVRIFLFLWKRMMMSTNVKMMISHSVLDGCLLRSRSDPGVLMFLTALSLSSGAVYVRRGSDITDCSMKCPHTESVLEVYRVCGDDESNLLELWCDSMWSYNRLEPRLHLNTSSGCWTLTDAGEDDSCVYNVLYHSNGGNSRRSIHIIVLDPVLVSNITSNSSLLGQDIAVSVQFSGEEAAVTWEVDGGPVPDRYRLIDGNRTMIILSAQIDDAGRRLHVRITNPVSEETREYQLEITAPHRSHVPLIALLVILLGLSVGLFLSYKKKIIKPRNVEVMMIGLSVEDGRPPQEPIRSRSPHHPDRTITLIRKSLHTERIRHH